MEAEVPPPQANNNVLCTPEKNFLLSSNRPKTVKELRCEARRGRVRPVANVVPIPFSLDAPTMGLYSTDHSTSP